MLRKKNYFFLNFALALLSHENIVYFNFVNLNFENCTFQTIETRYFTLKKNVENVGTNYRF